MYLLPCELLHLIAKELLPRYQCRLALTSRHCYHYLYTDLLQWHAKKYTIAIPKCRLLRKISVHVINGIITCYNRRGDYLIIHTTNDEGHNTRGANISRWWINSIMCAYLIIHHGIGMVDGLYKYMSNRVFNLCVQIRISPLLSLPSKIIWKIMRMLHSYERRILICAHEYLCHVFNEKYYDY